MKYKIIADTACDLSKELQEELNISYVPFKITVEDKEFIDDDNIDIKELIEAMGNTEMPIKTACPAPFDYLQELEKVEEDNIFIITISKHLSASYNSANIAANEFKEKNPKCNFYFFLAPNAGNIMKSKLPKRVNMANQNEYMTEFFKNLNEIGITPIDARKTLRKNIDKQQLYYRTDHHWTTGAAYLAYKEAHKEMGLDSDIKYKKLSVHRNFRGTLASKSGFTNGRNDELQIYWPREHQNYHDSIYNFVDAKKTTSTFYAFDNLKKKDAYTIFGGWNHPFYTISTPTKSARKLLLVKDSYANCMIPFLTQDFREIVVVDPRYYFGDINKIMAEEGITDVLFLYNALTFASDESMNLMLDDENQ